MVFRSGYCCSYCNNNIYYVQEETVRKDVLYFCALIIGGGIGNLIDRIFYGFVVDYISVSFFPPVCNFADYCITVGTLLLIVYVLFFSNVMKSEKKVNKSNE
ncbi:signal peptidase II [Ruminococcus bromii]|nr:signal peptidase II [Ruminococcus sp. AM28-29LB]RGH89804.1 signal peptidase II [Ruminococcus sp. AM28-29LB]RGS78000.1 signal peptidase II [Ruminococcus bromii]